MFKFNGKTFYNKAQQKDVQQPNKKSSKGKRKRGNNKSGGFHGNPEISVPSSSNSMNSQSEQRPSLAGQDSNVIPPQAPVNSAESPIFVQGFSAPNCPNFSRSLETWYHPKPTRCDFDSRPGKPRKIIPRGNQHIRALRFKPINEIITNLLTKIPQEYCIVRAPEKYAKCINYFTELLEKVNGNTRELPRTIIFTTTHALSLHLYLTNKCGIPALIASPNPSKDDLKVMFAKCHAKDAPILIFQSRIFEEGVDNVDLVINYCVPPTLEEYGRRLCYLMHKKCITYISSDEDRRVLHEALHIVEMSGRKPPQTLQSLFAFDPNNLQRFINEFIPCGSWMDFLDMD